MGQAAFEEFNGGEISPGGDDVTAATTVRAWWQVGRVEPSCFDDFFLLNHDFTRLVSAVKTAHQ